MGYYSLSQIFILFLPMKISLLWEPFSSFPSVILLSSGPVCRYVHYSYWLKKQKHCLSFNTCSSFSGMFLLGPMHFWVGALPNYLPSVLLTHFQGYLEGLSFSSLPHGLPFPFPNLLGGLNIDNLQINTQWYLSVKLLWSSYQLSFSSIPGNRKVAQTFT